MLATDNDTCNDYFRINTWVILPPSPGVSQPREERGQPFLGSQRSSIGSGGAALLRASLVWGEANGRRASLVPASHPSG